MPRLIWLLFRWPRTVDVTQVEAVWRLLASSGGRPLVCQAVGSQGGVEHCLAVPAARAGGLIAQLRSAIPGLVVSEVPRPVMTLSRAIRVTPTTRRRSLRVEDPEAACRAILTALTACDRDERVVLQWVLGRRVPPRIVPNRVAGLHHESWGRALLRAPFAGPAPLDIEHRNALRAKQAEPAWRALGRIAVQAKSAPRAEQLLRHVVGAMRSTEAPGVRLRVAPTSTAAVGAISLPWRHPAVLNLHELVTLSSWPVGTTSELPVRRSGSRAVAPSRAVSSTGRVIGRSTWPGSERPLALSIADSLRHTWILGPTGVGKSTLLLGLIEQSMQAGEAVVVIEPKDLVADVLQRVPAHRIGDVVLIDPADDERPVGFNPLATGPGRPPEMVADQLLAVFRGLFGTAIGPRSSDILFAALASLAQVPGSTLAALPILLSDAGFRRRIVGQIHDPIGLGAFWQTFENWSEAERTTATAPVLNKVRPFLRPQLRRIIGQPTPGFDMRQVFTERKILLVNLSKGILGPEAAGILGSTLVASLWQATTERSRIAPERRHPVMVFIDEFQDFVHLPTDLGDALAASRSLGVAFHLAHQALSQLPSTLKSAVLANARSKICFQLAIEDARVMAGSSTVLEPEDFQSLGAFEIYAQLMADGAVTPWCSAVTLLPSRPSTDPERVRRASRERYGVERAEIDAALEELVGGRRSRPAGDDLGPRRRAPGGRS